MERKALISILVACEREFPSFAGDLRRFRRLISRPLRERIIAVMRDGAAELGEIADEAGTTPDAAARELAALISEGLVEERYRGGETDRARGARRRLYFLSDEPSGCNYRAPASGVSSIVGMTDL